MPFAFMAYFKLIFSCENKVGHNLNVYSSEFLQNLCLV